MSVTPSSAAQTTDVPLIAFDSWGFPSTLGLVRADGTEPRTIEPEGSAGSSYGEPAWSPNGTKLAYVESNQDGDRIHILSANGTDRVVGRATPHSIQNLSWSPDGTTLLFTSNGIRTLPVAGDADEVATLVVQGYGAAFNDAGTRIAFGLEGHIWSADLTGDKAVQHTNDATDCPGSAPADCGTGGQFDWEGNTLVFEMQVVPHSNPDPSAELHTEIGQYVMGGPDALVYRVAEPSDDIQLGSPDLAQNGTLVYHRWEGDQDYSEYEPEIFVEGRSTPIGAGRDADWQPCPGGTCPPFPAEAERKSTTISVNYSTNNSAIRANGQVVPNAAGDQVVVKLSVKRGGDWDVVGTKKATLSAMSRYVVKFAKPKQSMCRLTARYTGSEKLLPSVKKKDFSC